MFNAGIFDFKSPQHTNRKEPFNYSLSVQQSLHRFIYSKVSGYLYKDTHMVMNHPMIIRVPFVHCLIYHRDSNVKFCCTMVYILLCEQITHSIRSSVGQSFVW